MSRRDDTNRENSNVQTLSAELLRFEKQLQELTPRPVTFALHQAHVPQAHVPQVPQDAERLSSLRMSRWAVAASLLLMWGIGAGMGAGAVLVWVGLPTSSDSENTKLGELAKSNTEQSAERNPQEPPNPRILEVPESPQIPPSVADQPNSFGSQPVPTFLAAIFPWRSPQAESNLASDQPPGGVFTTRSIRQATAWNSRFDNSQQWPPQDLDTTAKGPSVGTGAPPGNPATYQSEFEPATGRNQRDLLRGMLEGDATRVF